MKVTKAELRKIIKEELEEALNEVELAPAMYMALKAKGQLPPGATVKKAAQPQGQQVELAPAMYMALKAKGQLPPGATVKKAAQPQGQQQSGAAAGASANKQAFTYMKMLNQAKEELADAEAQNALPQVFKLKQKIAKLQQMIKKTQAAEE